MLERASRVDTRGWRESPAVKRGQDECRDQHQGADEDAGGAFHHRHQLGGRSAVGDAVMKATALCLPI